MAIQCANRSTTGESRHHRRLLSRPDRWESGASRAAGALHLVATKSRLGLAESLKVFMVKCKESPRQDAQNDIQLGRRRVKTGGVAFFTRPPQAAMTAYSPSGVR